MKPQFDELAQLLRLGLFFELHEKLESYWLTLPETDPEKLKVQALIQLVVAFHHKTKGNVKGFEILQDKALSKLRQPATLTEAELKVLMEDLLKELFLCEF